MKLGPTHMDWPNLMRAGIAGLRLAPDAFWALTPRELALLLGVGASPALRRADLLALMAAHPDRRPDDGP